MSPTNISHAIIRWLRPSRISSNDDLSTALAKKSDQDTISSLSVRKLLLIANGDCDRGGMRIAGVSLASASVAVQTLRNAADRSAMRASAKASLDLQLDAFSTKVKKSQVTWTEHYWGCFNPDEPLDHQTGASRDAAAILGEVPDPSTQCKDISGDSTLIHVFRRLASTRQASLPEAALDVLDAAFLRIHGISSMEAPVPYALSGSNSSGVHDEKRFFSLPRTTQEIAKVRASLARINNPTLKLQLAAKLTQFDARVEAATARWLSVWKHALEQEPRHAGNAARLAQAQAWLGLGHLESDLARLLACDQIDDADAVFTELYHLPLEAEGSPRAPLGARLPADIPNFRNLGEARRGLGLLREVLGNNASVGMKASVHDALSRYDRRVDQETRYWQRVWQDARRDLQSRYDPDTRKAITVSYEWLGSEVEEAARELAFQPDGPLFDAVRLVIRADPNVPVNDEDLAYLSSVLAATYALPPEHGPEHVPGGTSATVEMLRDTIKISVWLKRHELNTPREAEISKWLVDCIEQISRATMPIGIIEN